MDTRDVVAAIMLAFVVLLSIHLIRMDQRVKEARAAEPTVDTVYVTADSTPCTKALTIYRRKTRALQVSLAWERRWQDQ